MPSTQKLILTENQVVQKIKRIAFEIYEHNFQQEEIVLVGVIGQGVALANQLSVELKTIAPDFRHTVAQLTINKENPLSHDISLSEKSEIFQGKSVILVDDVLNSGRTLAYSLKVLMETNLKRIQTAALVDRSHKKFPVVANFKGYELSTTIDEHVEVRLENEVGVYLY